MNDQTAVCLPVRMLLRLGFLLVALLGLAAKEAHMSQISFQPNDLEMLIQRSDLIVLADRDPGAPPPDQSRQAWLPPTAFIVRKVLYGRAAEHPAGSRLLVEEANRGLYKAISEHIKEHGYNGVPSVARPQYASSLDQAGYQAAKTLILFLRENPVSSAVSFVMQDAYESSTLEAEVLKTLKKVNASRVTPPGGNSVKPEN